MNDRSASARSTSDSRASWFMDQTFGEKIPLDRPFADLFVQPGQPGVVGRSGVRGSARAFGKQRADPVDHRLLPGGDLAGMDAIPAG